MAGAELAMPGMAVTVGYPQSVEAKSFGRHRQFGGLGESFGACI